MLMHCSLDIEGASRKPQDWVNCITVDGKTLKTIEEVKSFFEEHLKLGHKVLPLGGCDNFDYETGCKGHKVNHLPESVKQTVLNNFMKGTEK